jgi:hypothetical protein
MIEAEEKESRNKWEKGRKKSHYFKNGGRRIQT